MYGLNNMSEYLPRI